MADDFTTLRKLKEQIKAKTKAGFLASEFFRVALKSLFDVSGEFVIADSELEHDFSEISGEIVDLVVVRYSKLEAEELRHQMTPDEHIELDHVLKLKRNYAKVAEEEADKEQNDSILRYFITKRGGSEKHIAGLIREKSSEAQHYSKEMIEAWASAIQKGAWESIILPPPGFPVICEQEDNSDDFISVSIDMKLIGIANLVAGFLNEEEQ